MEPEQPTEAQASAPESPNAAAAAPERTFEEPEPIAAGTGEKAPCPVVGVGASAGGLEALQGLFTCMPGDADLAFVVIQHRATDRSSVMKSLLEKYTPLKVHDVVDDTPVEPGTIYLTPGDKDVEILNGIVHLVKPTHTGLHLPIDSFLRSLALDQGERAICIILSGTGSDGTLGLKEIKAAGGMAMAQQEEQAKYDSMPRSAVETGMVDFVLPVEKMAEQLLQYTRHPFLTKRKAPEMEEKTEDQLQKVFVLIRRDTGHDFSHYKRNTIRRRIARRMAVHQIEELNTYVTLLQDNHDEVRTLARELLITVTNFFRDREAFEALRKEVITPLVESKPVNSAIRIWVAGCATGEEAYSVAMLLHEEMTRNDKHHNVQVFATDLDEESINTGRRGLYPKSVAGDIPPHLLKRYFTEEDSSYRMKNVIREMLVFAKHNLIKDAPFSKLDLICCRNVLIYMDTFLQKKVLPMFHYTLHPGGYLFLGESESIGVYSDLFVPIDARHKVFRRKAVETGYEPETEVTFFPQIREAREKPRAPRTGHDMSRLVEKVILRDYSLPCVLVDEDFNALYFNGDTSRFLMQPGGEPTTNIVQMARPDLHYKLNLLLKQAFHEKRITAQKDVQIRVNDHYLDTDIVVRPIAEHGLPGSLALVVFKTKPRRKGVTETADGGAPSGVPTEEKDARIRALEQDLQSTKEYLQTTIEELETSNEELKSSNEELQSTNEELQSTNEELDTSREELQSTNEELRTVNAEHQQKIDELSNAYDDLNNLMGATEIATLFLDHELRIRRFTPAATKLFRLMERDVGRPLPDITTNLIYGDLVADIRRVLDTLTRVEREIDAREGVWYQMKIVPYRTAENVIEGAIVTFVDITEHRRSLLASEERGAFAAAVAETVREPLLVLDETLRVVLANPAFYRAFRVRPEETLGAQVYELGDGQWNIPDLRRLLEEIVPQNTRFADFEVAHHFPRIGRRTMLLNARQIQQEGQATRRILLAFEDVTDRKPDRTEPA